MNQIFNFLTKEEENALTPEQKKEYRKNKKNYEEMVKKEKEDFFKAEELLTDFQHTKEEYLKFFEEIPLSSKFWKIILLRNYSAIYSFRKKFGVLGRDECNNLASYLDSEGNKYLYFIEAIFEFFPYEEYGDILQKILIEGLKFPAKAVRNVSIVYLRDQISKGNIGILFWRDLLEKKYVSGSTWQVLMDYHETAVEQRIDKDICAAIHDFMNNSDKYPRDITQTTEKWKKLNINLEETYK